MGREDRSDRLKWLLENPEAAGSLSSEECRMLLEDLSLHQTELEMQNEELKRAQAVIEESRERLSDLYDFAPVGYLTVDRNGVIEEANLTAAALLGTPRQELIGKPFFSFVLEEYRDAYFLYHRTVGAVRKKETCELKLKSRTGRIFYGGLESVPVGDGYVGGVRSVLSDVTERKLAEEALKESEEKYRDLVESVNSVIVRVDTEGRVIFLNGYGQRFFGYSTEEIQGKSAVGTIVPKENISGMNIKMLLDYIGKHPEHYRENEMQNVRRDGEKVWVSWTVKPLYDADGRPDGILGVGNDITTRKRLEEDLRQAQKMEAIGTLSGGIAHDFNNILGVILGFTEMAIDDVPDRPLVQRNLNNVLKSAIRARDLVKQILAFSRRTNYERTPLSLIPIIKETIKLLRATIPTTIKIRFSATASPDTILASPVEVQQILMNLVTNASLAMQDKGGPLDISLTDINFTQDSSVLELDVLPGEYLRLMVKDTGVGMSHDVMKKIFEPFFTTREVGSGTGMGLAVVYGIVKDLQGAITVESEQGSGSTFRVFLPRVKTGLVKEPVSTTSVPGGTERILFVDDEDMLVEWGQAVLERLGYSVTALTDSKQALEVFSSDPSQFDLVITDHSMPGMSGVQLAKALLKVRPNVPIVLCTGHSETVSPDIAKETGIRQFLLKPLAKQELAEVIRHVLDASREG
jgi:PAS domain S-box-containing protein